MKLPIPRRWRPAGEPALDAALIDITVPRECVYKSFEDHPGPCPRCGGPLQRSRQTYLVLTRRGRKITDSFIVGSDFGWFCAHCPTVVINPEDVSDMLQYNLPGWDVGTEFVVAGIIDLDAVPEDKQDVPLGEDDNPIPLVEFTACATSANISRQATPRRPSRRARAARRRRGAPIRKKKSKRKKRRR